MRVYLLARDLFFRTKLRSVVEEQGGRMAEAETQCDLAVVELGGPDAAERIRAFVGLGVPVLAFGSHRSADVLREARDAGAEAVPNSEVERRLRALLAGS